ncbi:sedoheptulose-1,7-bisphosphatase-like protein [Plenodomus tracheiphilus IPT5]|uniref:Sedoheptulose-1,7-bisphosphatase-like protein n=1 Tax=Plenodomus tracheiphilus IPT5 TaxID=1408161 RepID=A0A6A7B0Y5_9PLEO|nr:sedoheptulose-1,7-bisphosphatase-like protein [Plenodomus tracheiphilus IPT5]
MANPQTITLDAHLESLFHSSPSTHHQLRTSVLPTLLQSLASIASTLRSSPTISNLTTTNPFGDTQLNVDVAAEHHIRTAITSTPSIVTASSEEDPIERSKQRITGEQGEVYTLAFDPLDGSSIIAPNWSVGCIIGLWTGVSALNASPDTCQIASILGVFGPRTTAIVALRIPGVVAPSCFEVGFSPLKANNGAYAVDVLRENVTLSVPPFATRYFAPANLRAAAEEVRYRELIMHFVAEKYTLRYSGGLVPDVVHALVKGHGVYVSPVTEKSKAKLRRLYELAPVALILECAGGLAIDAATGERILGREIRDTDERAGLVCGNKEEVELVREKLIAR